MKQSLVEILICPNCLPNERGVSCQIEEASNNDIISGHLSCPQCRTVYPIREGTAILLPPGRKEGSEKDGRYESAFLLASYLWSHYGDLLGEDDAAEAYRNWAGKVKRSDGLFLDAGCAVGRFAFEMTAKNDFVIGLDRSISFIQCARSLMSHRHLEFHLVTEGMITQKRAFQLPDKWDDAKVEFIVGDVQSLPFPRRLFSSLCSLNLVDKVPSPLQHLQEMDRVAELSGAQFLFSDPFSWTTDMAEPEDWLGGTDFGPYAGRGLDNIVSLLEGRKRGLGKPWTIEESGRTWWKIRNHCNHFELIGSCFIKAHR